MKYEIRYGPKFAKSLRKLPRDRIDFILSKIEMLAENPRSGPNIKSMQGNPNQYRLRVQNYRIVYEVIDERLYVLILQAYHRGDKAYGR